MANLIKEHIIAEIRDGNKNIQDMLPETIAKYVKIRYKCSTYIAKTIAKELTNDRK
jgi:hypothetical protein